MEKKRSGIPALGAAIALALSLTACGGVRFEEYPSVTVTEKAEAQPAVDIPRAQEAPSPTPEFFTDAGKAGIAWMDHLKTCTPYSESYQNPYVKKLVINTILGREGDYCLATMLTTDMAVVTCRFDADGIKALTSDVLYAAMTDIHGAEPDAPSNEVMKTRCEYEMLNASEAK